MLSRLLAWLGLSWYVPTLPGASGGASDAPTAEGTARLTFVAAPGVQDGVGAEESPDARRQHLTADNVVWPGKRETISVRNEDVIVRRLVLSLTDLEPGYYECKPSEQARTHPEGGVILDPDEVASFDVVFAPVPSPNGTRARCFSFVVTRFDPQRTHDSGEIIGDMPMRWVSTPVDQDLAVSSDHAQVTIRPWRRTALLDLRLLNRSLLPPSVKLRLLRGFTPEGLQREPEEVGSITQSLEPGVSGVWHCLLPPASTKKSYFVTATGTVIATDNVEHKVALPKPVFVRYVPWLRMGRDWVFLLCVAFLLLWTVWGIPWRKSPIVRVAVEFADGRTFDRPDDFSGSTLTPYEGSVPGKSIHPEPGSRQLVFQLPPVTVGHRGPFFGWNGSSREPIRYAITLVAKGADGVYRDYDLDHPTPKQGRLEISLTTKSFWGTWADEVTLVVQPRAAVRVNLIVDDLGPARNQAKEIEGQFWLNGQKAGDVWKHRIGSGPVLAEGVLITAAPGAGRLVVEAWTLPYRVECDPIERAVQPDVKPVDIHLRFEKTPNALVDVKGPVEGYKLTVRDDSGPIIDGEGPIEARAYQGSFTLRLPVKAEPMPVYFIATNLKGDVPLTGGGPVFLKTAPGRPNEIVTFEAPAGGQPASEEDKSTPEEPPL